MLQICVLQVGTIFAQNSFQVPRKKNELVTAVELFTSCQRFR